MKFKIRGGKPLEGEITLSGAKNAATKLMVASLLTEEPITLENFPRIGDTEITAELLREIGSTVHTFGSKATLHTPLIRNNFVRMEQSRKNRIPILALGPLLASVGEAEVPVLGGDKIGARPVDLHVRALEALGANVELRDGNYCAVANSGLRGATIDFPFPSVGATENAMLAAVLARGETVLRNAALEPEIMDLVKFLQKMGAIIELGANRDFHIEGVKELKGATHRILPDRNEAVSFACLAIATKGKVLVREATQDHLITFLNVVRRLGAAYEVVPEGIIFSRPNSLRELHVETATHPGFMTDWQQPLAVVLTQARGVSTIHETIYENRFGYANDLNGLGGRIEVETRCPEHSRCRFYGKGFAHLARVHGPTELRGGTMIVRDLRAGIVNVIAALAAGGTSEIEGIEEIDRGYERIDERLRNLGAEIERT